MAVSRRLRFEILKRDGYACRYDGVRDRLCTYLNDLEALGYTPTDIERRYVGIEVPSINEEGEKAS